MTPIEGSKKENEDTIRALSNKGVLKPPKFKLGDYVRIPKKKGHFEKGYTPRWTEEVFQVSQILNTVPRTYKLIDYNNEPIQGSFYEQELQKTEQEVFRVKEVIKSRGKGKNKEYFVSWMGYPKEFNSWVSADSIGQIK